MELNYIIVSILQMLLSSNGDLPISSAIEPLNITRRILLYNLEKLNYNLKINGFPQIEITEDRLLLDVSRSREINEAIFKRSCSIQDYILSQDERRILILLIIGLARNSTTLNSLSSLLYTSKNTTISDISHLKTELADYGLALNNRTKQGYCIEGDELTVRYCLFEYMSKVKSSHMQTLIDKVLLSAVDSNNACQVHDDIFKIIYKAIESAEIRAGFNFSHNTITEMVYYILLIICRSRKCKLYLNDEFLKTVSEYEVAQQIINQLEENGIIITQEEIPYFTAVLLGAKRYSYRDIAVQTAVNLHDYVNDLIDSFENIAFVKLEDRGTLVDQLLVHVRPMYYRLKYQISVSNRYSNNIKNEYPDIFRYTRQAAESIGHRYGFQVSDEELAYICIYFVSWLTRRKLDVHSRRGNILIICGAGIGTSLFLQQQIREIIGRNYTIDIKDFKNSSITDTIYYDLIISTIDLPFNSEKVMKVDAVLSAAQKNKILNWSISDVNRSDNSCVEDIISLVEQSAVIVNRPKMVIALRKYLEYYDEIRKIRLKDALTHDMVSICYDSADSITAIRSACDPLVVNGLVGKDYADSILKLIKEKGLYSEIVPGILLAHAEPAASVNGVGLSLTAFPKGVSFDCCQKEKIKIIFTLCTPNNRAHFFVLNDLRNLLTKSDFISELKERNFSNSNELYQFVASRL